MATILTPFQAPGQHEQASANGTKPAPEVTTMTVTPDFAREWTARNTRNRPVRYGKVAQFARDMEAGKWDLNGETIKIDADGNLLDGQHRLYACIQAETPFESVVIRGLPPEAQDTIDTGVARKMSDQLALRGETQTALLAAIARWMCRWQSGSRAMRSSEDEPTHAEMLALIETDPGLREAAAWAAGARQRFKSVTGSVYGVAWLLFHRSDHAAAGVFLEKVLTGEDCKSGDPALAFRNRIWRAREDGERLNQYEQLAYLVAAWNAFRDGRPLKFVQTPKGGWNSKNFPEPK